MWRIKKKLETYCFCSSLGVNGIFVSYSWTYMRTIAITLPIIFVSPSDWKSFNIRWRDIGGFLKFSSKHSSISYEQVRFHCVPTTYSKWRWFPLLKSLFIAYKYIFMCHIYIITCVMTRILLCSTSFKE